MNSATSNASLLDFYRDEVLPRLRPEQVYTDPVHQWQEASDRWRGACPWHESASRTSFVVTIESKLWYCTGCGIGGDPIQYVRKSQGGVGTSPRGQDFVRVLRKLAELAGVPFPEREMSAEELKAAEDRAARQSSLETVFRVCQEELWSERGTAAREHLHDRGLGDAAIKDLGLGLYPALATVETALRQAGHRTESGTGAWGKMADYITLPWRDDYGHALTLYGRWPAKIPPDGYVKTLALPGKHSKSSPLYFDRARRAGHRCLVLVEGVLDAAVAQALGLTDVVAYVGSTLSRDQLHTLARHRVSAVTICPDPDSGGDTGIRSLLKNIPPGIRVYVAPRLPDNTDPDEFILKEGVDVWRAHLRQSLRGVVWSAREILRSHDLESAPGHDAALEVLERLASGLDDDDLTALVNEVSAAFKPRLR